MYQGVVLPKKFPYSEANFTEITGALSYIIENNEYLVISFSTTHSAKIISESDPGIFGIAIFKRNGKKWILDFFEPFAAAIGTNQNAGRISKVIRLDKKNVGFCMLYYYMNNGAITERSDLQLFTIQNKQYINILYVQSFSYQEKKGNKTLFEYKSEICDTDTTKINSDIIITQKGSVNQDNLSEVVVKGIEPYSSKYKKFIFEVRNTYKYNVLYRGYELFSLKSILTSDTSKDEFETVYGFRPVYVPEKAFSKTANLDELKQLNEKSASEIKLYDNTELTKRLRKLIGNKLDLIKNVYTMSFGIKVDENLFIDEGCQPHNCGGNTYIIVYDFVKKIFYVGIDEGGDVKVYSENGQKCQRIETWLKELE